MNTSPRGGELGANKGLGMILCGLLGLPNMEANEGRVGRSREMLSMGMGWWRVSRPLTAVRTMDQVGGGGGPKECSGFAEYGLAKYGLCGVGLFLALGGQMSERGCECLWRLW